MHWRPWLQKSDLIAHEDVVFSDPISCEGFTPEIRPVKTLQMTSDPISCAGFTAEIRPDTNSMWRLYSWLQTQFYVNILPQKSELTACEDFTVDFRPNFTCRFYCRNQTWQHMNDLTVDFRRNFMCRFYSRNQTWHCDSMWRLYSWPQTRFHVKVLPQKSELTAHDRWLHTQFHAIVLLQKSDQTACEDNSWLQTQIHVNDLPQKSDLTAH